MMLMVAFGIVGLLLLGPLGLIAGVIVGAALMLRPARVHCPQPDHSPRCGCSKCWRRP